MRNEGRLERKGWADMKKLMKVMKETDKESAKK